jgi:hypothetical protein
VYYTTSFIVPIVGCDCIVLKTGFMLLAPIEEGVQTRKKLVKDGAALTSSSARGTNLEALAFKVKIMMVVVIVGSVGCMCILTGITYNPWARSHASWGVSFIFFVGCSVNVIALSQFVDCSCTSDRGRRQIRSDRDSKNFTATSPSITSTEPSSSIIEKDTS